MPARGRLLAAPRLGSDPLLALVGAELAELRRLRAARDEDRLAAPLDPAGPRELDLHRPEVAVERELEPDLLRQLAPRRRLGGLAGLDAASWEEKPSGVRLNAIVRLDQQEPALPIDDRDVGAGAPQRKSSGQEESFSGAPSPTT
jgi:hypothetical protein